MNEEHAENLPDTNFAKGKFYRENILYLDEKGNEISSELEKQPLGQRPKKRKRAASCPPRKDKAGDSLYITLISI